MTINPIIYPVIVPKQPGFAPKRVEAIGEEKQESIFLASNGNKLPKQAAFGEYEKKIQTQNALVRRHEEAHQRESGSQASGSPVYEKTIDKDGREIITGGHQNVKVPELIDKNSPLDAINKIIEAARLTIKGAKAPESFDDLSAADRRVAARGEQILSASENAKSERLSLQQRFGIKPDEKINNEKLAKNKQTNNPKQALVGQNLNLIG